VYKRQSEILLNRIDGELSPEQDKQLNFIRKSAESLAELVDDSLDLAKVEAGKVTVRVADFEVEDLFSALRGMMRPLLPQNSPVSLIFEVPLELPTLTTDEGKVSQILRNLISNALKFTEAGEVRVAAEMGKGGMVTFSVADTGIGIPTADQTRIFEEFVQVENHLQKGVKGTGLGLSLCRKMAEFLGGSIKIESSPGVGSTFLVNLPIAYAGDSEVSAEISESQPEETGRAIENLRSAARDRAPKVAIVKEQKSFSVFAERLAGRNPLYCDVRRQRW
jgi:signal transduction histidine kinase